MPIIPHRETAGTPEWFAILQSDAGINMDSRTNSWHVFRFLVVYDGTPASLTRWIDETNARSPNYQSATLLLGRAFCKVTKGLTKRIENKLTSRFERVMDTVSAKKLGYWDAFPDFDINSYIFPETITGRDDDD